MNITTHDIAAAHDVIMSVAEAADDLTFEQCIAMLDELRQLKDSLGKTIAMVEARAKKSLDGQPARVGDAIYMEKPTGKWRPDQKVIRHRVASMATCDDNGEMLDTYGAAARAVDMMYNLFVSPSTMPKQAGLKQLGVDNKDIATWERTGSELKVIPVGEEPQ